MENPKTQEFTVIVGTTENKNGHNYASVRTESKENVKTQKTEVQESVTSNVQSAVNTGDDNKKTGIMSNLKISQEFLSLIVGLITSVAFILAKAGTLNLTERELLVSVDVLNILVLVTAIIFIRSVQLKIEGNEVKKLLNHLGIEDEKSCDAILERTNELIKQLVYCIRWFAIILGVFYIFQFFTDYFQPPYETIKKTIDGSKSIMEILSDRPEFYLQAAKYLFTELLTNSANLFSASFLFLAFQVLFLVTLAKDNKQWKLKSWIPNSLAIVITVLNIYYFFNGVFEANLGSISHIMRLIGGVYNGVAMFLLFSRFISMEYFFQNSSDGWQKWFYFYGTVVVLPLYVVAQPLYGIFNAIEIGQSAELFKAIVFLVCFWGKLFFLLFIYTMLTKKWIHSYLFIVLSQKDTLSKISIDLKDVEDLKNKPESQAF